MKYLVVIIGCICFSMNFAFGQSSEKPFWATSDFFMDLENSYIETIVVTGEGTRDAMREKAREIIVLRRDLTRGARVYFGKDETENNGLTVASKAIGEYIDGENFVGYFLMQTLKNPTNKYEKVNITDRYRFSARVFVPGMAQIYKGSKTKGALFIAGEAMLIVGAVVMENLRANENSLYNTTHDKKFHRDNAIRYYNIRNGLIAGVAAVYVWNIIDGWVAKGKKHLLISESTGLKILPYATPSMGGINLTLNLKITHK